MSESAKRIRVRDIYKGRVVHLTSEEVILPNGHRMEIEVIRHPGASAMVPLGDDGQVTLIRQYRHAVGGFIYEVPAGKLDHGEPPEVCARRELTEEIGVVTERLTRLGSIVPAPGFADEVIHLFLAEGLTPGKMAHEDSEVITLHHRTLDECLRMIANGEIIDSKSICALFLADRFIRERAK